MSKTIDKQLKIRGKIKCPICNETSAIYVWDGTTHDECTTRERRRAFVSLNELKAYNKNSKLVYMCPVCKSYSDGYKLKPLIEEEQADTG